MNELPPEEEAALAAYHLLGKWLPSGIGPVVSLAVQLARMALQRESDPVAYLRSLLEADARRQAEAKWGPTG
jgi:hypothetical protein